MNLLQRAYESYQEGIKAVRTIRKYNLLKEAGRLTDIPTLLREVNSANPYYRLYGRLEKIAFEIGACEALGIDL
ncbi:MAG: hypothetical protein AABX25_03435 [Nanoarchaeota archaeon]